MSYKTIDLFSGAGGLHIGFENAGFDIKLCIDNDNLVEQTHKRNFPNIPIINRDIREITVDEIKQYIGNGTLDVVIGGPPCQGFSTIGKRVSSDPEKRAKHDSRNDLVLVYANLIKDFRPKFIVMENVKGILTLKNGEYLKNVMKQLEDAGYDAKYKLINMADYGVPEIRERVIIIGNRVGLPVSFPEPDHSDNPDDDLPGWNNCWDAIKDLELLGDKPAINHVALKHTAKNIARYKLIPEGGRLPEDDLPPELYRRNFGNTYKRLSRTRPALTMVPGNDAFPIHPTLHRSLTVREAARIQTFPDSIIFEGNRRQQGHQVGNAVPPMFSEKLANFILSEIQKAKDSGLYECD
ncbi:cytosine-specific methyltransferase [Lachnospiraceae bacterium]|uniref:DNA cytosine methyltransferase n=1 Tax=Extibacter sp. GGCC_0201 TaxID=2731209 RepID=UPI001AA0EBBD|nr:DNA cytosine methyltransferase [Extibacter sp. GGCC_0201]MBO1720297.1 DNA cytosine methyltransferase [Extibacter sp. GGCC_0201]BDF32275.1 cytosine-specific methyltransferase [Lachnospiraceae bacterium]BDF36285.1 cytosine-specific methyltransferase [Lachnospiraceae bacterium]